jgi:hypothetical protein
MDSFWNPIDFSGIVGYPHDISEDAIDNIPEFDHAHASLHVAAFGRFVSEWCDPPIYEDVLMRLFVFTLIGERESDWFHDSPDNTFKNIHDLLHAFLKQFGRHQQEVHDELVDIFMGSWEYKNMSYIETISSDSEVDIPSNPIEELDETCETIEDRSEIMEDDFTETYIEYLDPHGLELDNEKDKEVHVEISDGSIDESVIYFEEVKELEFENVGYLDDLSSHPPPDEPIFLKNNFENLEENFMMVPVVCSSSVFQPEDELMQNHVELEGNFSLSMSYHYEYRLASHLDGHVQQNIQNLHGLSYSRVWLKGRRMMILGWFFLRKNSKLIKLGKGSSVSHPGLGLFRHLWHHFTHSMGDCNVSLTFPCSLMLYNFDSLCRYVLKIFFFLYHSHVVILLLYFRNFIM